MEEGGPLVDCGVHQIHLARWRLDSEVAWQRGIGVWLDDDEAPDHNHQLQLTGDARDGE